MNRLTKIRQQNELNKKEIELNYAGDTGKSWHKQYATSAWIYVGSLPYDLNEGDIITVFSQYGEIVNINLIRDRKTGKSRGFCYLCYADQRSTNLAVDNFNGIKIVGRIIQVDHVEEYKVPKYKEEVDDDVKKLWEEGCAPKPIQIDEEAAEREARLREKLLKKEAKRAEKELAKVDDLDEEFKQARKARKKLEKAEKKREKYAKKLAKRLREATPDDERGRPDDDGRWDNKKKRLDEKIDDLDFYGNTEHFNFKSGKRKTPPPPPSHNIRPDFEKADWRDWAMFQTIRDIDKATKGDKPNNWKEEEHYVPKRIH
jgi:RNA-binding motif X-linked protein 2